MLIENLVPMEGWQILWQREQILITSISSVSHNIFTWLVTQGFLESVVRGIVFQPFLAPLALGQRAYVMVRCPSCIRPSVRPSVRPLTFSLNIFFAETAYRILMKFHRNVPTMVLFRIS